MAKTTQISRANAKFSFNKGYMQVRQQDAPEVKRQIMEALNFNNEQSWRDRRYGRIEPKMTEVEVIEAVFSKFGIKKVWGL